VCEKNVVCGKNSSGGFDLAGMDYEE